MLTPRLAAPFPRGRLTARPLRTPRPEPFARRWPFAGLLRTSAPQSLEELGGQRLRLDPTGPARVAGHPHSRLETLDGEGLALHQTVFHLEARATPFRNRGVHDDVVTKLRGHAEVRAHVD